MDINPEVENVHSIKIKFTVYQSSEILGSPSFTVGMYAADAIEEGPLSFFQTGAGANLAQEQYVIATELDSGAVEYEIDIPYSEISKGGLQKLVFRFWPEVTASNPEFSLMTSGDVDMEALFAPIDIPGLNIPVLDVTTVDDYSVPFGEFVLDSESAARILFNGDANSGEPQAFLAIAIMFDGVIMEMSEDSGFPLRDFSTMLEPEVILQSLHREIRLSNASEDMMSSIVLIHDMIDPETNLVRGGWMYNRDRDRIDVEVVMPERETHTSLGFAAAISKIHPDTPDKDEEPHHVLAREIFETLAVGIAEHEIVEIGGEYYYAPEGISADGQLIVRPEVMGNSLTAIDIYKYIKNDLGNAEKAERFLIGFANTLDLMLEMQEQTPTNLFPEKIIAQFSEDESSYSLIAEGDEFYIGNDFFLPEGNEYMHSFGTLFEMQDEKNILNASLISSMPGNTQEEKWAAYEQEVRVQDAVSRLLATRTKSLNFVYRFYLAQGETVAARYNINTGKPIEFIDGVLTTPCTPGEATYLFRLAIVFGDVKMQGQARHIMATGLEELSAYFSDKYGDEIFTPEFWQENQDTVFVQQYFNEITKIYLVMFNDSDLGDAPNFVAEQPLPVPFGNLPAYLESVDVDMFLRHMWGLNMGQDVEKPMWMQDSALIEP